MKTDKNILRLIQETQDVCRALEIQNRRDAASRLDNDEKNTVVLTDGIPGNPNKTIVNKSGLD